MAIFIGLGYPDPIVLPTDNPAGDVSRHAAQAAFNFRVNIMGTRNENRVSELILGMNIHFLPNYNSNKGVTRGGLITRQIEVWPKQVQGQHLIMGLGPLIIRASNRGRYIKIENSGPLLEASPSPDAFKGAIIRSFEYLGETEEPIYDASLNPNESDGGESEAQLESEDRGDPGGLQGQQTQM
ncbi:hypothetical protein ABW19_dt0201381 [Dactylella cylindrospora]|nr:hypothetical protein ABW19_dt0201381 [Dactylella cylindrospora]